MTGSRTGGQPAEWSRLARDYLDASASTFGGPHVGGTAARADPILSRRKHLLPELWLEWAGWGTTLLNNSHDLEDAVAHVVEQVQDWVIEEVWTGWRAWPGHGHPRKVAVVLGSAVWACPAHASRPTTVGRLGLADDPTKG